MAISGVRSVSRMPRSSVFCVNPDQAMDRSSKRLACPRFDIERESLVDEVQCMITN